MGDIEKISQTDTPAYVVDENLLIKNLEVLKYVQEKANCKILLALKGFSMHAFFPLIGEYLAGITSSSLFEAKLGREKMDKEVHAYAPAFADSEFEELVNTVDHLVFNSFSQWKKYKDRLQNTDIECGLRINPEYSEVETDLYNPCFNHSRLGIIRKHFERQSLEGIDGLHFHTLCEQNSDTLERTIEAVEEKFGEFLPQMKWLNLGGGHHITRSDYDVDKLIRIIRYLKEKYSLDIYLEPGEAIALNTGFLVTSVLDIVENGMQIAITDASAACHMPDVLEMPYRPEIIGAGKPGEFSYTYRLAGNTCLAGDVIGDYSFKEPLTPGDKLIFCDMAHYTMVKNNMFNGLNLPSIVILTKDGKLKTVRTFHYEDYKNRLS